MLDRLLQTPHEVTLVLTRPDRAAGRGMQLSASPVKRLAAQHGCPVLQPASLRTPEVELRLREALPDVLVVVAYGMIVPPPILAVARLAPVNVHASLLPCWRGAAPIQRALLAGDRSSGISIMRMDESLDTGPVYEQRRVEIDAQDDAGSLHDKLAVLGGQALLDVLDQLAEGRARPVPQPEQGATYAAKIDKRETQLDWRRPAVELERAIRAFCPAPGATARLGAERLKLWRAQVVDAHGAPGAVVDPRALVVACATGGLRVLELQRSGGRRVSAEEFLRGRPLAVGTRFE